MKQIEDIVRQIVDLNKDSVIQDIKHCKTLDDIEVLWKIIKDKNEIMDPYILGYWLGDGDTNASKITTEDLEIVEYFKEYINKLNLQFKKTDAIHYSITTCTKFGEKGCNGFANMLRKYKLLGDKHIPDNYKYNNKDIRLKVLAGLIDSDGHLEKNVYDFTLKCEKLVDDAIFLIRSLEFFTYKTKCKKTCTNSKNGPVTGDYFRFHICGEGLEDILVLLIRKKAHERMSPKDGCVKLLSIGKRECCGFELDGNKRFLMEDFTVTSV